MATVLYCRSNKSLQNRKRERTSNVAPLSTRRPFQMTTQISLLKHTMSLIQSLIQLSGKGQPFCQFMWSSREVR